MNNSYLHQCFDAQEWVKEWMKTIKDNPTIPLDEDTMLTWFSSAIMAGFDYANEKNKAKLQETDHQWYFIDGKEELLTLSEAKLKISIKNKKDYQTAVSLTQI